MLLLRRPGIARLRSSGNRRQPALVLVFADLAQIVLMAAGPISAAGLGAAQAEPGGLQLRQEREVTTRSPGQAGETDRQGEAGHAGAHDVAQQGPGTGGWGGVAEASTRASGGNRAECLATGDEGSAAALAWCAPRRQLLTGSFAAAIGAAGREVHRTGQERSRGIPAAHHQRVWQGKAASWVSAVSSTSCSSSAWAASMRSNGSRWAWL